MNTDEWGARHKKAIREVERILSISPKLVAKLKSAMGRKYWGRK